MYLAIGPLEKIILNYCSSFLPPRETRRRAHVWNTNRSFLKTIIVERIVFLCKYLVSNNNDARVFPLKSVNFYSSQLGCLKISPSRQSGNAFVRATFKNEKNVRVLLKIYRRLHAIGQCDLSKTIYSVVDFDFSTLCLPTNISVSGTRDDDFMASGISKILWEFFGVYTTLLHASSPRIDASNVPPTQTRIID